MVGIFVCLDTISADEDPRLLSLVSIGLCACIFFNDTFSTNDTYVSCCLCILIKACSTCLMKTCSVDLANKSNQM